MATVKLAAYALPIVVILGFVMLHDFAVAPAMLRPAVVHLPPIQPSGPPLGFVGAWEAVDPGTRPSRVIIQHVDAYSARVLYTWGDGSQAGTWLNARAKITSDGKLYWRMPGAFRLALSADGQTLTGERESGGWKALATFRRVSRI